MHWSWTKSARHARSGRQDHLAAVFQLLVEHLVAARGIVKLHVVADDDFRLQLAVADVFQQPRYVVLYMGLANAELQALVDGVPKQEAV